MYRKDAFSRKLEFDTRTLKEDRFPFFERICWLMAEVWMKRLKAKTARTPKQVTLDRLKILLKFVDNQLQRRQELALGSARTTTASLPRAWRDLGRDKAMVNGLPEAIGDMEHRLAKEAVGIEDEGRGRAPEKRVTKKRASQKGKDMADRAETGVKTYEESSARRVAAGSVEEQTDGAEAFKRSVAAKKIIKNAAATVARQHATNSNNASNANAPAPRRQEKTATKASTKVQRTITTTTTQPNRTPDADSTMNDFMRKDPVRTTRPGRAVAQARPSGRVLDGEMRSRDRRRETIREMGMSATRLVRPAQTTKAKGSVSRVKSAGIRYAMDVAPGKEQKRLEIRLRKRKAPEDPTMNSGSKRRREREGSVVVVEPLVRR
ncbi:hypothetical protein NCC49_001818 [Naganishia albida]|nr:hypothetical protein NCC49_001818 [Naganishia albida]